MVITIKGDDSRFGVRVAAIIYNKDMSKVFMQRQSNHDFYMFPGGRLEIHEDAKTAIMRELDEELGIKEDDVFLKYISENFISFPNQKYHEIGFYFIIKIDEQKYQYFSNNEYNSLDEENDGKSKFRWISLEELNNISIMPCCMKDKLFERDAIESKEIEHIIYREYDQTEN